jgi:hypothetical protein
MHNYKRINIDRDTNRSLITRRSWHVIKVYFMYFDLSQHILFSHWPLHDSASWRHVTVLRNSLCGLSMAFPWIRIELCETKLIYVVLQLTFTSKKTLDFCDKRFTWLEKIVYFIGNIAATVCRSPRQGYWSSGVTSEARPDFYRRSSPPSPFISSHA